MRNENSEKALKPPLLNDLEVYAVQFMNVIKPFLETLNFRSIVADIFSIDRNLATDYIKKGMMRFVDGTYSIGHDYAAMLGFVIDGKAIECVNLICERVNKYKNDISLKEDWTEEKSFATTQNIYRTRHVQSGQNDLMTILHLFLIVN